MPYAEYKQNMRHAPRFVEYVDIFSSEDITPSAGSKDNIMLFDTFAETNPLEPLRHVPSTKIYQSISYYLLEGEITYEINGKDVTLTKNTVLNVMPENTLEVKDVSPDIQYFMVVTYPKVSNQIFKEVGLTYSNARLSLQYFATPVNGQQMQDFFRIYNDIKRDMQGPDYEFKAEYIRSLLNGMMVKNINIHQYDPVPLEGNSNSRQYDVYCRFLALLNKHAIEHRTVLFYANQLNISSKYLSFVCTSYSKKNASAWIDDAVIQKAKAMILVHHYSLIETSEALHFPTVSSFSRFFKRVVGMTPREFSQKEAV
jgi:AraC-like DNA-binding protein